MRHLSSGSHAPARSRLRILGCASVLAAGLILPAAASSCEVDGSGGTVRASWELRSSFHDLILEGGLGKTDYPRSAWISIDTGSPAVQADVECNRTRSLMRASFSHGKLDAERLDY